MRTCSLKKQRRWSALPIFSHKFSKAAIENQFKNLDAQFDQLAQVGLPEESRLYLGMMGFRIVISIHGEVLDVVQPGMVDDSGE